MSSQVALIREACIYCHIRDARSAQELCFSLLEPQHQLVSVRTQSVHGRESSAQLVHRHRAFVREFNVWIKNRDTAEESQLTHDGTKDDAYHEPVLISPDGTRAIARRVKPEQEHTVHFIESSPKDPKNPQLHLQPKLHSHQYDLRLNGNESPR